MRISSKSPMTAALAAALTATLCIANAQAQGADKASASAAAAPKASLTVDAVQPRSEQWASVISASGSVASWQEAVVGPEIGGLRIQQLLVEVGERVRKGQLLARLSAGTLEADLAAGKAAVQEAQVSLREAAANARRMLSLKGSDAVSEQQIEQAVNAEAAAQARLATLQARLQADELRLAYTRITAPDDGLITARDGVEGSLAQPGQELFRLQRRSRLEWRAEVPAAELPRLRAGQAVRVQAVGAAPVQGRVRLVSPRLDPQTRAALVYVDLPAAAELRAGLFARGEFQLGEAPVLTLPQSAVLLRDGFSYVFLIGADQRVRQHKVELGRRQGERVEVRQGLDAKARVAAGGLGFLSDGAVVRVASSQSNTVAK